MNAQVQKYIIWAAGAVVILIAISLIRGKTVVNLPVEGI